MIFESGEGDIFCKEIYPDPGLNSGVGDAILSTVYAKEES